MAFTGLLLKGVGPFERLWLDLSDGHGKPHLGPHVIAGVNGCGKSTVLKGLAWTLGPAIEQAGFPMKDWERALVGWPRSGAVSLVQGGGYAAVNPDRLEDGPNQPPGWLLDDETVGARSATMYGDLHDLGLFSYEFWMSRPLLADRDGVRCLLAGYAPARVLKHIAPTDSLPALRHGQGQEGALSFDSTVNNLVVQNWLRDLLSRVALAKAKGRADNELEATKGSIQDALTAVFGVETELDTEIETGLELRFRLGSQNLDFSQLPDGVRNLLGWIVDFVRRRETARWHEECKATRPSVLLIDEVDAHLHPKWQRTVLTALRAAFPDVQIIVTTHSPFVVASCEEARIHVLGVREDGRAEWKESMNAPVGEDVMAVIKDVFGVSWYDVKTERLLREWNELKREEAADRLGWEQQAALEHLTSRLAARSESLRMIVTPGAALPESLRESLGQE